MGWWSADVLGGDAALDVVDALAERCGLEQGEYLDVPIPDEVVERVVAYLSNCDLDVLAAELGGDGVGVWADQDRRVAVQVVAVVSLAAGVALGEFAERCVGAARSDDWECTGAGSRDPARRTAMAGLVAAVEHQRAVGGVVELRSAGLFEAHGGLTAPE